jgi:hypothetical protein
VKWLWLQNAVAKPTSARLAVSLPSSSFGTFHAPLNHILIKGVKALFEHTHEMVCAERGDIRQLSNRYGLS